MAVGPSARIAPSISRQLWLKVAMEGNLINDFHKRFDFTSVFLSEYYSAFKPLLPYLSAVFSKLKKKTFSHSFRDFGLIGVLPCLRIS
jgi:hypothetical protein